MVEERDLTHSIHQSTLQSEMSLLPGTVGVKGTNFECIEEILKGPLLLAFAKEDPGAAARVIRTFSKEHEALRAVALSIGGQLMPSSELKKLADLPTLEQARAMVLGVLLAPISRFARTISEPQAMLVRTLSARNSQEAV